MPNIRSEIFRRFIKFSKLKVSLLHEETSERGNKYFVRCYAPWLKDGIYTVTNVGVEILMYIHSGENCFLFIGNSTTQFNHKKPNKQSKKDILMKLMKNPNSLWTWYKIFKNHVDIRSHLDETPPSLSPNIIFFFFNLSFFCFQYTLTIPLYDFDLIFLEIISKTTF